MSKPQNASAQSNTSPNAENAYSQPLHNVLSSTYERNNYENTMIVINCRTTGEKQEWFASLGTKRLTDFYEHEHQLYAYMETIPFLFTLMTAIAEDMFDYKLKIAAENIYGVANHPIDTPDTNADFTNHQIKSMDQNQQATQSYDDWLQAHNQTK